MDSRDDRFAGILERNHSRLARICRAFAGPSDADDLLQEIHLNLWKSMLSFRGDSEIDTWVYRVAVNTALVFRRSEGRRFWKSARVDADTVPDPSPRQAEAAKEALILRLLHCIAKLAPRDRLVVSLVLEGLPHKEIAAIAGTTPSNVAVILHRMKPSLGACVESRETDGN